MRASDRSSDSVNIFPGLELFQTILFCIFF